MKIIDKRTKNMVLDDLEVGQVFTFNNNLYMKVETICDIRAVRLSDGALYDFGGQTDVLPVNAELIIS